MKIRHLPRHCCPVLDNVGSVRLASLEYYTMSMETTLYSVYANRSCIQISCTYYYLNDTELTVKKCAQYHAVINLLLLLHLPNPFNTNFAA